MLVDSMMELYEMGVVTNARKALKKGKFITTFAMGSRKFYDWLDDNVAVEFQRGRWTNDPSVVSQNSKMVSINTCISVDLTGQVASESIGPNQYSGTGGQSDTATGAVAGFDGLGKSIIACYGTAKNGTVSTIVPMLPRRFGRHPAPQSRGPRRHRKRHRPSARQDGAGKSRGADCDRETGIQGRVEVKSQALGYL